MNFSNVFWYIVIAASALQISCTPTCRVQGDCQSGEYCNPIERICVEGCTSDQDCNSRSYCEPDLGLCRIRPGLPSFRIDAGTSTVTSTMSDAG